MNIKRIGKIIGLGLILVILGIFAVMGFIFYDVMSYTATSSETLNPAGTVVGNALVVYDPGITGNAKNVAFVIAGDLQSKGYKVDLAGINSAKAVTTSGYDIIVIGGPTYIGAPASSIKSYLQSLKPSSRTRIGVFGTGGVKPENNDFVYMRKFVTALPDVNSLKINAVVKIVNGEDTNQKVAGFVNSLLQ